MADVEIFMLEADLDAVIRWVRSKADSVVMIEEDDEMIRYDSDQEGVEQPVIVQKNVEDSNIVGVWFNYDAAPWPDDAACARDAFADLGYTVQCDPGDDFPMGDEFLQIDAEGERVVRVEVKF